MILYKKAAARTVQQPFLYKCFYFSWLALSVKSFGFASSPKGRAFGSPRKPHLFAKASPFGRGGIAQR